MKCEKCGAEIAGDGIYETNGKMLCEDCSITVNSCESPKKNCAQQLSDVFPGFKGQ